MSNEIGNSPQPPDPLPHQHADVIVAELAHGSFFLDRTQRLRTVWRFLIFGGGLIALQMILSMPLTVVMIVALAASGDLQKFGDSQRIADPQEIEQDLTRMIEDWTPPLMAISALPLAAMTFALLFVCRRYLDRRSIVSTGFVRRGLGRSLAAGLLVGLAPIAVATAILSAAGCLSLGGFGITVMGVVMIPTLVLMAFTEEIMFRSYLLQNLLDIRRPVFGVVFTSVVFWIVHAVNPYVWSSVVIPLNMIGAGVILALAYMLANNIWFPTALHFGWNAAQGPLLGLPVSGIKIDGFIELNAAETAPLWLTGGEFGLEASLVVTALEVVMIGAFIWILVLRGSTSQK